ncbi:MULTISPECIES: hypothetical protein [unclassified Spirosoma]|uniref:hypothetical protein n=1 Tax=unclassified Spirosoma TaxID=2621999 RepID=UPI000ABB9669|nr:MULTISPECIES: hypothetical protein [unclassified Spirosoma]MBN8823385.1 hypothetical protein [Spirosoma sp.]
MMLLMDGMYKGVHYENVAHWVQSYESAFELLTQLVVNQWTLTTAILVDNGDCLCLPVEAFDGQPILDHIQALELEWTQLLLPSHYSPSRSVDARLKDWYVRLDIYYGDLLAHLERIILLLENRKLKILNHHNEAMRSLLSSKYESRLELNRKLHLQTQNNRQTNQQRLRQLEG